MLKEEKIPHTPGCLHNEARLNNIETFLATLGYTMVKKDLIPKLEQNAALHGHLIGDLDIDQIRQDSNRQHDLKKIAKNSTNIKALKSTQDQILRKVNDE